MGLSRPVERVTMPWRSWSVSQAQATSKLVFVRDHGGHGVGAGAVHADSAVPVAGHEAEGGVDVGVQEL